MAAGLLMVEDFIRTGKKSLEQWLTLSLLVPGALHSLLHDLEGTPAYRIPRSWAGRSGCGCSWSIDPLLSTRLRDPTTIGPCAIRDVMNASTAHVLMTRDWNAST